MGLLFHYYGQRFIEEVPASATIDILYYIVIIGWYCGCSLFAIRTHELSKRSGFFSIWKQERETEGWKKLLRDIPEPIIFIHQSDIIYYNKAVVDLFDINEGEFAKTKEQVWNSLESVTMKYDRSVTLKETLRNSTDGLTQETLFIYKPENNKKRLFMIKSVNTSGVIEYILHDVTAWKDLEKNKAKNQCFDILLATASHDIKTPLNVMLGVIDVLSDFVNSYRGKEQINVALSCGQRMLYYLKGLDFIRQINTNTLQPNRIQFNPSDVASKIIKGMEFSAQAKNLTLGMSVDGPVPKIICTDKEIYSIILQNLMENAIKYTFTGGINVTLSFDNRVNTLSTAISDTGIGMTEEQQQSIGVLFKKTRSQTILNPQGLGLGLYLAKTLTNQLDGEFSVESVPGKGTIAKFMIKCDDPREGYIAITDSLRGKMSSITLPEMTTTKLSCECAKVLLVDDEPFNLLVFSAYLDSVKMTADKAVNGQLALDLIDKKAANECCKGYSVIFMDINMPVMDGIESALKITELVKQGKIPECKVVAVTAAKGLDRPEVYSEYVSRGFTELCKFFDILTNNSG